MSRTRTTAAVQNRSRTNSTPRPKSRAKGKPRRFRLARLLRPALIVLALLALFPLLPELLHNATAAARPHVFTVCIDAGHGGHDVGCSQEGRNEADDVLTLALATREALERRGIRVIMTRDDDTFVELEERANIANRARADCFLCIHRNFYGKNTAHGIELWHSWKASPATRQLAADLEQRLVEVGVSKSRGCKGGSQGNPMEDYTVLRLTKMPAVLVEMGFLSNEEDNALFDAKLEDYAEAMAAAVAELDT